MNLITKSILSIGLLAFVATQLYLTIFGGFLWPFSSHRLFSQLSTPRKTIVQAVLVDSNNNTYTVHPGRVVPIEYSRCSGLIRNVCTKGSPEQKQYLRQFYFIYRRLLSWELASGFCGHYFRDCSFINGSEKEN